MILVRQSYNLNTINKHSIFWLKKRLNDNLGMVFGYSRRTSSIEQNRLIGYKTATTEAQLDKQNHQRLSDNLLLNFNWTPQEKKNVLNSVYVIQIIKN